MAKMPPAAPIAVPLRELRDLLGHLGLGELDLLADELLARSETSCSALAMFCVVLGVGRVCWSVIGPIA